MVIESAGYIVIARAWSTYALFASVTLTVKLLVPAIVGVPLITPVDVLRLNPAGRLPVAILQTYGVLPPAATSVCVYDRLTVPSDKEDVVIDNAEYIVIDNAWVAVAPLLSVTCTVKLLVPATVGVPLITPADALRERPAGSVPTVILHIYGVLPPPATSVEL